MLRRQSGERGVWQVPESRQIVLEPGVSWGGWGAGATHPLAVPPPAPLPGRVPAALSLLVRLELGAAGPHV